MPTLEWIGKDKVINHHQAVPYRVLKRVYSFDENGQHEEDNGSRNMIIHGDNLEALKSLLPRYEGKVKCIYIDPPYNTGNEGWVYNDNVSDPKIKKWLGEVVGKEGEDLSRHDKWLCMMYPRLMLLQKLLHSNGCLIVSISYHEVHTLSLVLKEIFATRQVVTVTVQTSGGKPSSGFNYVHEYLIFVVPRDFSPSSLGFSGGNKRSPYEGLTLSTFTMAQRPNQTYPIYVDAKNGTLVGVGKSLQELIDEGAYVGEKQDFVFNYDSAPSGSVAIWPVTSKGKPCVWRQISKRLQSDWEQGFIKITPNRAKKSQNKFSIQYLPIGVIKKIKSGELKVIGKEANAPTLIFGDNETVGGQIPTMWNEKDFFTVRGTNMLEKIFPESPKVFDYPKPVSLVRSVIQAVTKIGDIVLDSFAGSGTTGQAVLEANLQDDLKRQFVLIELDDEYAETVTAERIKRTISGTHEMGGVGGDFSFYELSDRILDEEGMLNAELPLDYIREYVWFMETHHDWPKETNGNPFYLGAVLETSYYFYYEPDKVTVLNHDFLATIPEKKETTVIYADRCTLSESTLTKYGIVFKKIPRDITKL